MKTQRVRNNRSVALVLAGIIIGATVASVLYFVNISMQPTIYDRLAKAGITYYLSPWEPSLLENRTYVHQFREFDELVQLVKMLKIIGQELVVSLDRTYNIIWRTDSTNEGWISIYFYTEPD